MDSKAATSKDPKKKKHKAMDKYFLCKKPGHMKKDVCIKYHTWHEKNGMFITLVYFEVNLASTPKNIRM